MAITVHNVTREIDPVTGDVIRVNGSIPSEALIGGFDVNSVTYAPQPEDEPQAEEREEGTSDE